jgi:hypothetical protein
MKVTLPDTYRSEGNDERLRRLVNGTFVRRLVW